MKTTSKFETIEKAVESGAIPADKKFMVHVATAVQQMVIDRGDQQRFEDWDIEKLIKLVLNEN